MLRQYLPKNVPSKSLGLSFAVTAIAGLLLMFALPTTAQAAPCSGTITMIYNGSVQAELVDCGCRNRPLGGLARRVHLIEQIRAEHPHTLMVDAGNLFGDPSQDTLAQSRFVAAETAAMGFDVIGVGPYEIGHGVEAVQQIAASTGLHFVNANLLRDGGLLFDPFRIVDVGGVRVGVIGVFDPEFLNEDPASDFTGIVAGDPAESLRKWLPEIHRQADVIVVLSSLKSNRVANLLRELNDDGLRIDFVVDGISSRAPKAQPAIDSPEVLVANRRGKRLGQIDITLVDGAITHRDNEVHALDINLPEAAEVVARVEAFQAERQEMALQR